MRRYSQRTTSKTQNLGADGDELAAPEQSQSFSELQNAFRRAYPMARRASQVRAAGAVATGAVADVDAEDLAQEGILACWQALSSFDPHRASLRTFIERVVATRMITLHRARTCRPRLQPIEDDQHQAENTWAMDIELRSDVERVLSALSDSDRRIALALIDHTPTEATRLLGIARSTVYERLQNIRLAFAEAGLRPEGARRW